MSSRRTTLPLPLLLYLMLILARTPIVEATIQQATSTTYSTPYLNILKDCEVTGPLGMITGLIQDWQITASSTYPLDWDKACQERYARVYQPNGVAWCAKHKSASEWLQVDLGLAAKVTGLVTQGRGDGMEWVVTYLVSYSVDGFHWQYVNDQYGNQRIFDGNSDSYSVKHAYLDKPFLAKYIKFHTSSWNKHPSMRVEIIGCQVCRNDIALPPYAKISASSEKNSGSSSNCQADDGYILTQKSWCAKDNNNNQWLQFDIGPPTLVTGLVTRGRGEVGKRQWVTRYRLSHSNDTTIWYFYKDNMNQDVKRSGGENSWGETSSERSNITVTSFIANRQSPEGLEFGGNFDKDTERIHYLNSPFTARYIRFHPLEWNNHIGLRAGLIGCPYLGNCGPGFMRIVSHSPCVENLSYKKDSWINNKRQYKRHVRNQWLRGHASRAVDGDTSATMQSCTVLDNFYVDKPTWMVDLGQRVSVSGVKIVTWQGKDLEMRSMYRDYMYNLDKLTVFVDVRSGKDRTTTTTTTYLQQQQSQQPQQPQQPQPQDSNLCGYISRVNDAIFQPELHIQCTMPLKGRYVYIEASGVATRWTRLFSAILCEVMIYQ